MGSQCGSGRAMGRPGVVSAVLGPRRWATSSRRTAGELRAGILQPEESVPLRGGWPWPASSPQSPAWGARVAGICPTEAMVTARCLPALPLSVTALGMSPTRQSHGDLGRTPGPAPDPPTMRCRLIPTSCCTCSAIWGQGHSSPPSSPDISGRTGTCPSPASGC